ncbi:heme ABC exporter ATP-binding protein CcmA [Methylocella silvestris]|uniref:Heme ABC exporter ATP-binding protein CcmA n=1 Tax=Methylocella silvestris TaxID=199596 RepID=A0A2J7TMN0_METSI|nr:heme ABC exporter ATP-binding protein CcmA [Methylocella silvestris]PNG28021.1 heme ABC exporter ATP-binding protein CcmA [Methylocella silvestris]
MRISASRLTIERGGRTILRNLDFTVDAGEMLIVTGRNGAGKSTLLRALAGLVPLASGALALSPSSEESIAEQAHYIGHADALKNSLTAAENLEFFAALLDLGRGGLEPYAALDSLGLRHVADLPAAYLSAGQKRRAALARLLVARRPIWLLDEPTTALDTASQALILSVIAAHLLTGGLVVASTHARLDLPARELSLGAAA